MVWLVQIFHGLVGDYRKISERKWLATPARDRDAWKTITRCDSWAEAQEMLEALHKAHPRFAPKGAKKEQTSAPMMSHQG